MNERLEPGADLSSQNFFPQTGVTPRKSQEKCSALVVLLERLEGSCLPCSRILKTR